MIYLEQGREPVSWLSLLRKNEGARGDTWRDLSVDGARPELLGDGEGTKNRNLAIPNFSERGQTSEPGRLDSSSATG